MQKLRLLLLLGLMFAVGGTLAARGSVFNDQNQKSDVKHNKAKNKDKNNDGHRKHWYSPPHWFHKKHHNEASTAKSGQTVAGKPASNSDIKPLPQTKPVTTNAARPVHKTVAGTTTGSKSATATGQHGKTVAGAKRRKKTDKSPNQKSTATASAVKPS